MRLLLASCFAMVGLVAGCTSSADTPEAEGTFVTVEEEPQPNTLSREEVSDGWILLFDGETLFGWTPGDDSGWRVEDGAIACDGTAPSALKTTAQFADFELRWESWIDSESDAGGLGARVPRSRVW